MQIEHQWLATSTADPSTPDYPSRDGTEVDGTGRVWSPPIRSLRSDTLLHDLNERQKDKL